MLLGEIPIEPAVDFDDFVRIHAQRQMKDLQQSIWIATMRLTINANDAVDGPAKSCTSNFGWLKP